MTKTGKGTMLSRGSASAPDGSGRPQCIKEEFLWDLTECPLLRHLQQLIEVCYKLLIPVHEQFWVRVSNRIRG